MCVNWWFRELCLWGSINPQVAGPFRVTFVYSLNLTVKVPIIDHYLVHKIMVQEVTVHFLFLKIE